ncbi:MULTISPECIES: hypothetical protein [Brevibacillus]|uniref:hypothetical protein n=1 Tax=Brevibacillus TaxID=55080 RepID=UPI001C8DD8CD|nr:MULTISPECIES: hypothetical protein [Brevibacillus]MBY0085355.1 hypothetical protein [Brevibacillus brevis]MCE0450428.1 hypothetical protein [Brevibacillus sp. AF8]
MKRLFTSVIPFLALMLISSQLGTGLVKAENPEGAIREKMLNAIDYYEYVEGEFKYDVAGKKYTAEFVVQQGKNPGSRTVLKDPSGKTSQELVADEEFVLQLNNTSKTYLKMKSSSSVEVPKGERVKKEKDPDGKEANVYIYRQDPAKALIAKTVTFPQEYGFWLDDKAKNYKITGEEMFLERNAVVISGELSEDLSKKLNSTSFEMWVDEKTGVLLKLITTDKGGDIKNSIEVLNINFETNLAKTASRKFDTDDTKGYKEIKFDDKKPSDKKDKK